MVIQLSVIYGGFSKDPGADVQSVSGAKRYPQQKLQSSIQWILIYCFSTGDTNAFYNQEYVCDYYCDNR